MDLSLYALVCILFASFCFFHQYLIIKRKKSIHIANIFGFMYGITYGVLPAVFSLLFYLNNEKYGRIRYEDERLLELSLWTVLAIIGYMFFFFFYSVTIRSKEKEIDIPENSSNVLNKFECQRMQITTFVCTIVGIVSLLLWTRAYGGIINLIMIADEVRSGEYVVSNSFSIFKHSAKLVTFSSYSSLMLVKKKYNLIFNITLLGTSFVFSVLLLLGCDGRMSMAIYFVILFLIAFDLLGRNIKFNKKILLTAVVGVFAMYVIMNMNSVTYYIRTGNELTSDKTFKESLLGEFAYILMAGQNSTHQWITEGSPLLILHDVFAGAFAWVPHSLKPMDFVDLWNYNTELCYNASFYNAQIPSDYVSTSIYDLGICGIAFFGAFWGILARYLDDLHDKSGSVFYEVAYYCLAMAFLRSVNYSMFYDFVLGLFYIFVAYIVWYISKLFINKKMQTNHIVAELCLCDRRTYEYQEECNKKNC